MARTDEHTKKWIDTHPLSQSDLINYGLHLLMQMEARLMNADVRIGHVAISDPVDLSLPEWAR